MRQQERVDLRARPHEGINLVASSWGHKNVREGDEIIIIRNGASLQHRAVANVVRSTGANAARDSINDRGELILEDYARLLNPHTKMVAVTHVSNALQAPSTRLVKYHRHGAPHRRSGADRWRAGAPHLKVDVQALDADFYALLRPQNVGPTGIGILYGKSKLLNAMPPYQGGGDMIKTVHFREDHLRRPAV